MNRTILALALGLATLSATAQDWGWRDNGNTRNRRTLLGRGADVSAFGSVLLDLGTTAGEFGTGVGGGGALMFDNVFFVGGYGMGLSGNIAPELGEGLSGTAALDYRHGGFWAGVNLLPSFPVHPVISARMGWGRAELTDDGTGGLFAATGLERARDNFFIVTPSAGLEANLTDWFTIRAEYGYRFFNGLALPGFAETGLDGQFATVSFNFGGFD
ncbi:MAG: outer membrane beta-barrel protein [Bacteroidia bacterium]|nr:outer membrane beta-barrel protein [Bacteroidia bacterium]